RSPPHTAVSSTPGRPWPGRARRAPGPGVWISPADAATRQLADGTAVRVYNERGEFRARALVTDRVLVGVVWMRDGWDGLNRVTSGSSCIRDEAVDMFAFSGGQASFEARVEVAAVPE